MREGGFESEVSELTKLEMITKRYGLASPVDDLMN